MNLTLVDAIVLLSYLGGVVALGCWLSRRSGSPDEFMAAGRSLPGWAVGLSIFGTYVSSISFLANPGKSYEANWNPFVFSLSLPIAGFIATRWFVPFYRRLGNVSAYEHLEQRFGPWARTYAVACYLLTQVGRIGTILYLVALAVEPLTGWSVTSIILVTGVLVIVYTLLGGIEAVIWTDVVQSVVLTIGMLVAVGVLVMGMPEGPGQVLTIAREHDKFSLGNFSMALTESTFWIVLVYGLFMNLQNFGIDQSYVQRYFAAKDEAAAKRSVWMGVWLYLPVSAVLFFVGTALFAFYQVHPELLVGADGVVIEEADKIFPHFIATELPMGMTGLMIAAILAAAMSSVDSSLNSSATLILCDVYRRYINPDVDDKGSMRVLYITTIVWGVIGIGSALAMINVKSALDVWWKIAGVFSGGMLGLFLLGRLVDKAKNPQAIAAVIPGVVVISWMALSKSKWWPEMLATHTLHDNLIIVVGTLTILCLGFAFSRIPRR